MPKLTIDGLDDFIMRAEQIENGFRAVASAAVYAGAGKAVEVIKAEINRLPEQQGYMKDGDRRNVVTHDEKLDLLDGIGIAGFNAGTDDVDTAVGFNGYSRHKTKKYPNGVPIPLIARAIESGSSVRNKIPFIRRAVKGNEEAIKAAMSAAAQQKLEELTK